MITRFAPSPTGPLHLGHAYSACLAHDQAAAAGGQFLLRIEDIDKTRARAAWEDQIFDDLAWLGLTWPTPVFRQSDRLETYTAHLQNLWTRGLLFACTCSRRDVMAALSAPQEGDDVPFGPDGPIYPGTCRHNTVQNGPAQLPGNVALRLNMSKAIDVIGQDTFAFTETGAGPDGQTGSIVFAAAQALHTLGDIVLARRDMGTSYHLSVVLDDAAQDITHVTRGQDLYEATLIHVLLQRLLDVPTPVYHHHRLIRDDTGKRLAKRHDARAIAKYRNEGLSPGDIRLLVGL